MLTRILIAAVLLLGLRVYHLEKQIKRHDIANLPGDWPTARGYWDGWKDS